MTKIILLAICILVPLTALAVSPNVEPYYTCGKAKQGAKAGVPDAQFAYGLLLSQGHCTFLNLKHESEAIEWWTKAASKGQADAMTFLGLLYLKGRGVNKDTGKAWQLIKNAADRGSKEALNLLELCQAQPEHSGCN